MCKPTQNVGVLCSSWSESQCQTLTTLRLEHAANCYHFCPDIHLGLAPAEPFIKQWMSLWIFVWEKRSVPFPSCFQGGSQRCRPPSPPPPLCPASCSAQHSLQHLAQASHCPQSLSMSPEWQVIGQGWCSFHLQLFPCNLAAPLSHQSANNILWTSISAYLENDVYHTLRGFRTFRIQVKERQYKLPGISQSFYILTLYILCTLLCNLKGHGLTFSSLRGILEFSSLSVAIYTICKSVPKGWSFDDIWSSRYTQ